jgi:hypothetical protein
VEPLKNDWILRALTPSVDRYIDEFIVEWVTTCGAQLEEITGDVPLKGRSYPQPVCFSHSASQLS